MEASNNPSELVVNRLKKERKLWRGDHPFGFVAKPVTNFDGTMNMLKWDCEIPGPKGSPWESGVYRMTIDFTCDYPVRYTSVPTRPPKCIFRPVIPHPNIYPSGTVCLSILNEEEDWKPHITVKQLLMGIQKLLRDEPNVDSPAQLEPLNLYKNNRDEYNRKVKLFAQNTTRKN